MSFSLCIISGVEVTSLALSKHLSPPFRPLEPELVSDGERGFRSVPQAPRAPSHPEGAVCHV